MNHYQQQVEDPECSSGCESGWTVYLDHSSLSAFSDQENSGGYLDGTRKGVSTESKGLKNQEEGEEEEEEEEEDLSMVSDASSGPPHFHEDTNACFYQSQIDDPLSRNLLDKTKKNKNNKMEHRRRRRGGKLQDQSCLLDDTASSPLLGFSNKTRSQPSVVKNALEYSLGYSTTQFEVRQPYQEHYDFFHSAPSGNQMQQNQWLKGKGW